MGVVEAHATSRGIEITARMTAGGVKLVFSATAPSFEEARDQVIEAIDRLLPLEKQGKFK